MTIAREGLREITISTLVCLVPAVAAAWAASVYSQWLWVPAIVLFAIWVFSIAFFRDPHRVVPTDANVMVSPADGKVTEVTTIEDCDLVGGPAFKVSIFLSVFDVHINRSPCSGRVVSCEHKPGEFLDARHPECGVRNEANTIVIEPTGKIGGPVIVRQIAGLIARRIICRVGPGDTLECGQRIGLIKFGSRTELIVPKASGFDPVVKVGDFVRGGATVMMRSVPEAAPGPRVAMGRRREEPTIA